MDPYPILLTLRPSERLRSAVPATDRQLADDGPSGRRKCTPADFVAALQQVSRPLWSHTPAGHLLPTEYLAGT